MEENQNNFSLAIVGSRNFHEYTSFKQQMFIALKNMNLDLTDLNYIVSGGAKGTDTLAERFAIEHNIPTKIFHANWRVNGIYDKHAGTNRNTTIVNHCTHMIAFIAEDSIGTWDSVNKAEKTNKIVYRIYVKL